MVKRKWNNDKGELRRLKVESDSELWGDSDDEQLMCDAVKKNTLDLRQHLSDINCAVLHNISSQKLLLIYKHARCY